MPATSKTLDVNTDPFAFGIDGDEFVADADTYSIPSFGKFKAGDLRRVRHLDDVSQMFTLLEKVADDETLDAVDCLSIPALSEFFNAWQSAAGASAGN